MEKVKVNKSTTGYYRGNVTITVKKKDKVVNSKKLCNEGTYELFKFIATCLCGDYRSANPSKPTYVNIYSYTGTADTFTADYFKSHPTKQNLVKIIPNTAAKVNQILDQNDASIILGYSATYKFSIPLIHLNIDPSLQNNQICNVLGFFNDNNNTMPAAFILNTDDDNNLVSIIPDDLLNPGVDLNDYVMNIQWVMQFVNQ